MIIPCFNARTWICEAVSSVLDQRMERMEILVIDDGSTDGSADLVEMQFPSVRVIRSEHRGVSHARNLGTRLSGGAWIQYLDADDLLAPDKLKRQVAALESSGADVAYGDFQEFVRAADEVPAGKVISPRLSDPAISLFTGAWFPPAAYLFRRAIVDRAGGWKEELKIIQDARFAWDCAFYGGQFVRVEGLAAYYRKTGENSLSRRDSAAFIRECFANARSVEALWQAHDRLAAEHRQALLHAYFYAARASYAKDNETFNAAAAALARLQPGFLPPGPAGLRQLSRWIGYRNAEGAALRYRWIKGGFKRLLGNK